MSWVRAIMRELISIALREARLSNCHSGGMRKVIQWDLNPQTVTGLCPPVRIRIILERGALFRISACFATTGLRRFHPATKLRGAIRSSLAIFQKELSVSA